MSFGKLCFVKSLQKMSLLSMPPTFWFRSIWKGVEKPSKRKLDVVNVLSSFVSVNTSVNVI